MQAPTADHQPLPEGSFLGSYRIIRVLAVDNGVQTYLAKHTGRYTHALLRLFPPAERLGAEAVATLRARCGKAAAMQHPGIARCSELLEDRGIPFAATELPDGPRGEPISLAAALAESPHGLPADRVAALAGHLCRALQFAHRFRGDGCPHGSLTIESIFLTSQRQPRITGFAHLGTATPENDLQALGNLFCLLLTGKPADPAQPRCAPGLDRQWDARIRRCLAAGTSAGFREVDAVLADLEAGPGGSGRALTWGIAAAMATIVALAGLLLVARLRPNPAPTVPLTPAEAAPQPVATLERPDPAVALQQVNAIKARAEALLAQTADIRPGDGFEERLAALRDLRREATGRIAALDAPEAALLYRRLEAETQRLLKLDADRGRAERARAAAGEARETAGTSRAETDAASAWGRAAAAWERGAAAWNQGDFAAAAAAYQQADDDFALSAAAAGGNRALQAARSAYEQERRKDPDLQAGGMGEEITALLQLAREAEAAGDLQAAASHWRAATVKLSERTDAAAAAAAVPSRPPTEQFARPAAGNLVINGDLERGRNGQPEGWSPVDNLTTFWGSGGNPGNCLRFDTNVQQKDKQAHAANPDAAPPPKSAGGQYGTVGAHEGVWSFASPIPILPADRYILVEADVMGPAKSTALFYPQVLVRGFRRFDPGEDAGTFSWFQQPHPGGPEFSEQFGSAQRRARQGDYLMIWRHQLVCRNSGPNQWEHYRLALELPDDKRFRPEVVLLKPYAMWPLGEYRFDNIRWRTVDREEYEKVKQQGHAIEGFLPLQ